jgi:hypothetical protein
LAFRHEDEHFCDSCVPEQTTPDMREWVTQACVPVLRTEGERPLLFLQFTKVPSPGYLDLAVEWARKAESDLGMRIVFLADNVRARPELLEALADLEHRQWAHWTEYFLRTLRPILPAQWKYCPFCGGDAQDDHAHKDDCPSKGDSPGHTNIAEAIGRWLTQIETPYEELSEREKESDREWVRRLFDVLAEEDSDAG